MRPLTQSLLNLPPLAARSIRWVAIAIDGLLVAIPGVILAFGLTAGGIGTIGALQSEKGHLLSRIASGGLGIGGLILCIIASVALLILTLYQYFLLATQAQTIGKRACGIRIVDSLTGKQAGIFQAIFLRSWVPWAITSVLTLLLGWLIPPIGALLVLLDLVPIFGAERRCAHDYLAGTQVRWVEARSEARMRFAMVGVGVLGVGLVGAAAIGSPTLRAATSQWQLPMPRAEAQPPVPAPASTAIPLPAPESVTTPLTPDPVPVAAPVPVPAPEPVVQPTAPEPSGAIYSWVDAQGTMSFTDDLSKVPAKYRASAKKQ
jgi:uncharacterized RDD family membrane protein YckC